MPDRCPALIIRDGKPDTCGGELLPRQIRKPFSMDTMIGGPSPPPLFRYLTCKICKTMFEPGVSTDA